MRRLLAVVPLCAIALVACAGSEPGTALSPAAAGVPTTVTATPAPGAATTAAPATAAAATAAPTTPAPATAAPTVAPKAPTPVAPGRVFLVGDSVMAALEPNYTDAARKVLGAAGWNVAIDAEVNRSTIQGRQVLKALHPGANDTVVLMLGHNDAGTPSVFTPRVEGILNDLNGVGRVFWLTMREPRYAQANAVLAGERAAHPNLRLIPWAASIQPGWTAKDGLHLNGSGATGMANLILQAISAR